MTTIAYRNGILACDTLATSGSTRSGYIEKARKVGPWVIAYAGHVRSGIEWLDWMQGIIERGEKFVRAPKEMQYGDDVEPISALAIKTGEIWAFDGLSYPYKMEAEYVAIGSGSDFALGAMAMGVGAEKAVKIASQLDCYTGGEIRTYRHG